MFIAAELQLINVISWLTLWCKQWLSAIKRPITGHLAEVVVDPVGGVDSDRILRFSFGTGSGP